jgi:hypothetical protein
MEMLLELCFPNLARSPADRAGAAVSPPGRLTEGIVPVAGSPEAVVAGREGALCTHLIPSAGCAGPASSPSMVGRTNEVATACSLDSVRRVRI